MEEYLRKYHSTLKIVDVETVKNVVIPEYWINALKEEDSKKRVNIIISKWKSIVSDCLPRLIDYLDEHLEDIILVNYKNHFSLIYIIKKSSGKTLYYEGANPCELREHKLLSGMPEKLRQFYLEVHNGFFYYASRSHGLISLDEVMNLGQNEWGIIEELNEPIQISLDTSYAFFTDRFGGYIVIDYANSENDKGTIWYDDDIPEYQINFWEELDDWILAGIGN